MDKRTRLGGIVCLLTFGLSISAHAQTSIGSVSDQPVKSASSKFFVGAGLEGNGIVTQVPPVGSTNESGVGVGLIVGYGFTPVWALYGNLSGANMTTTDGSGNFGLGHFDVGMRAHFLTGAHVVVPFVQAGLSGRAETQTFTTRTGQHDFAAGGAGVEFGGGLNVHVRPALAISAGVTWSVGNFSDYTVDKQTVPGTAVNATSARVHVGIVWFPQTHVIRG